jgi:hypothetical protein
VRDVASLKGEKVNYLSLMLVQNPKRVRGELRRGCRKRKEAAKNPRRLQSFPRNRDSGCTLLNRFAVDRIQKFNTAPTP